MTERRYCVNCVYFQPAQSPQTGDMAIRFGRCTNDKAIKFPHIRPGTESDEFLSPDLELGRMPYASVLRSMPAGCGPDGNWFSAPRQPVLEENAEARAELEGTHAEDERQADEDQTQRAVE